MGNTQTITATGIKLCGSLAKSSFHNTLIQVISHHYQADVLCCITLSWWTGPLAHQQTQHPGGGKYKQTPQMHSACNHTHPSKGNWWCWMPCRNLPANTCPSESASTATEYIIFITYSSGQRTCIKPTVQQEKFHSHINDTEKNRGEMIANIKIAIIIKANWLCKGSSIPHPAWQLLGELLPVSLKMQLSS